MKIALFTSNQPRHIALAERLSTIATELFVVQECNTVFPGLVSDFFSSTTEMANYFQKVRAAERDFFGEVRFGSGVRKGLAIKSGDLSRLPREALAATLDADCFVVFGASYIKGWLAEFLVGQRAINLHMGLSPYYRGSSCNFWALYDRNPAMVGATVHYLSRGLDTGPIIRHACPRRVESDPFRFSMRAVAAAFDALMEVLTDHQGDLKSIPAFKQDQSLEVRYSVNSDFTEREVVEFWRMTSGGSVLPDHGSGFELPKLVDPFVY